MNIEQIRSQLAALNQQIEQAQAAGVALAADSTASTADLRAAAENLENLRARADALRSAMAQEQEHAAENLQVVRSEDDAIQRAASKFHGPGEFFSLVARASNRENPQVDSRLADYASVRSAASGQNITTDAEGGYLVPPDYAAELLNVAQSESVLFPRVSRVPIAGNRLIVNEIDQESREDTTLSIKGRNGGLLAYWKGEAADYEASRMKFKQTQTDLHKLTGLCYATEEMLQDMPALAGIISNGFSDEFTFKIDAAIYAGTGSGMPQGVVHSGNTALVTVEKDAEQAEKTVSLDNILKMYNSMPARNRANAAWFINQDLEIALYKLLLGVGSIAADATTASFGFPLFVPAGGLTSAPNGMLLGRPIVPIEQASELGKLGDISLLDLSQYRWIDKSNGGMTAQTSMHVRFLQDELAFKFTYRAGGKPIWSTPIKAFAGGTKRSPFVALADRAGE